MTKKSDIFERLASDADAVERSWSLTADEAEERVLFFFENSVEAAELIASAARVLDVPTGVLSKWSFALPGADAIGLALRCDQASVRLYTQYWELVVARVNDGVLDPCPLYRGFKLLPGGFVRTDDYHCLPVSPRDVFWPQMTQAFSEQGLDAAGAETVFSDLTADTAIFTRTQTDERSSWLTTVRRAEIDRAALVEWAAPLANRPHGDTILSCLSDHDLVHLAGGYDTQKGAFFTIYTESTPEAVLAALGQYS